mmetsp:Transcript_7/g.15  ORF Transcript_7/g.15 Transcript_7/m.15 type:complete len:238 (-) Transcript_7:39-752(-)
MAKAGFGYLRCSLLHLEGVEFGLQLLNLPLLVVHLAFILSLLILQHTVSRAGPIVVVHGVVDCPTDHATHNDVTDSRRWCDNHGRSVSHAKADGWSHHWRRHNGRRCNDSCLVDDCCVAACNCRLGRCRPWCASDSRGRATDAPSGSGSLGLLDWKQCKSNCGKHGQHRAADSQLRRLRALCFILRCRHLLFTSHCPQGCGSQGSWQLSDERHRHATCREQKQANVASHRATLNPNQ